ncbi:hypothetical protein Smic_78570 [Streptomyces microflavus]|uniref:Uncharacterized protein n=1 Tax=Streptomyces microflavus TaxID=1919 RepID=A0A7J0D3J5_STRMI|nr:hypothetical protein Smic_78570 [Streptomyces microflavus]
MTVGGLRETVLGGREQPMTRQLGNAPVGGRHFEQRGGQCQVRHAQGTAAGVFQRDGQLSVRRVDDETLMVRAGSAVELDPQTLQHGDACGMNPLSGQRRLPGWAGIHQKHCGSLLGKP